MAVANVGVNDLNTPVKIKGEPLTFYTKWSSMLKRCYKDNPLYENVSVCDEWKLLSNFKVWHDINYYEIPNERMVLDKDVLGDSSEYSPSNCCYIPHKMNSFWNASNESGIIYEPNRTGCKKWRTRVSNCLGKSYQSIHKTEKEAKYHRNKYKIQVANDLIKLYDNYLPEIVKNTFINKTKEKYSNE